MRKFIRKQLREDLEYHHVHGDATADEYMIGEIEDCEEEEEEDELKPRQIISPTF